MIKIKLPHLRKQIQLINDICKYLRDNVAEINSESDLTIENIINFTFSASSIITNNKSDPCWTISRENSANRVLLVSVIPKEHEVYLTLKYGGQSGTYYDY